MAWSNAVLRTVDGPQLAIRRTLRLRSGYDIPQLGLGTYRLPARDAAAVLARALDCGYRHIDCARAYDNQRAIGDALHAALSARRVRRDELFVTSKLWPTDQHPDVVAAACKATLAELRLDYLDLYLVHWPVCWRHTGLDAFDGDDARKYPQDTLHDDTSNTPRRVAAVDTRVTLLDTWRAMSALVDDGLVRSIGVCNCSIAQLDTLVHATTTTTTTDGSDNNDNSSKVYAPVLNQVEYHPAHWDSALAAWQARHGVLTAAYCPLAPPTRHTPPDYTGLLSDAALQGVAATTGFSVARLLLNWNVDHNNIVLVKASSHAHLADNAKATRMSLALPARVVLDGYARAMRSYRVVNPHNFTHAPGGFFD